MTEILSETYATARDSWVDFVQGKPGEATPAQINGGAIPSPDFIALMHQAKADANAKIEREKNKPKPKGRSFDKKGLISLYESGQLVQGDLSGQTVFEFRDEQGAREIGMDPIVINIGTKQSPDPWTLRIPVKPEDRGIFLPKTKIKPSV
ncbi:MAG: hypothetical protein UR81_C0022G0005 [Candidatus Levybacteria bacterium GW2011_GWB1_35_5]|nr:MAG: hypothetical protein UR81_C0022G0005 [Candidatus Levybacteria bacterium GW2011_GWB1_35_5]